MAISTVRITVGGSVHDLTYNPTSGMYEATLTAPSKSSGSHNAGQGPDIGTEAQGKGYYPISLTAIDDAGNITDIGSDDPTWGRSLRLAVEEVTPPTSAAVYPTQGARISDARPEIRFTVTDEGSGVDPTRCMLRIDGGSPIAVVPVITGGTALCAYTPQTDLSEGSHTIEVYGTDYDGNTSAHVTASFTVDTVAPMLVVTSPSADLKTNVPQLTVMGVTSDDTSDPVTVTVAVNGSTFAPQVGQDGTFSQAVSLVEGANAIAVTATDAAGLSTVVTRTVTLDTVPPRILGITLRPNPAEVGRGYRISVRVEDP